MEYVLADRNSTGLDAYWFKRGISTLDAARQLAASYPEARYIIEYRRDYESKGMLPTGRSWPTNNKQETE